MSKVHELHAALGILTDHGKDSELTIMNNELLVDGGPTSVSDDGCELYKLGWIYDHGNKHWVWWDDETW